ncbi:MAG: hypothetical protein VX185_04825 [Pseudomonadota bacterium]|nr:hypothetical protein [Pseudomonadota bacterium]
MATTINFKANNTTQYSINGTTLSSICKKLSSCSRGISSSKLLINIEEREKKATIIYAHIKREDTKDMCSQNPHIHINARSLSIINNIISKKRVFEFKAIQTAIKTGHIKDIALLFVILTLKSKPSITAQKALLSKINEAKNSGKELGVDNIIESTLVLNIGSNERTPASREILYTYNDLRQDQTKKTIDQNNEKNHLLSSILQTFYAFRHITFAASGIQSSSL